MINHWHQILGMTQHDKVWHEQDLMAELNEYYEETNLLKKWSELSDVVYTCTRGQWSSHDIQFPFPLWQFMLGAVYMTPKYSGRWLFYRYTGKKAKVSKMLHEVRNPQKTHKLHHIAKKYDIDPKLFQEICEKQLKYWPL